VNYRAADRGDIVAVPTAEMSAGEWNHVAVTFNYEDDAVTVYHNGQVVRSDTGKLGAGSLAGVGSLLLGQAYANGHMDETPRLYNSSGMYRPFNLDEFIMVQKALTPAEVSDVYGLSAPFETFVPTAVTVVPTAQTMAKGSSMRFVADVTGTGDKTAADNGVAWTIAGAASAGTAIDARGVLTIAADETADRVTVTAASDLDNSVFGAAAVTVRAARTDGAIAFGVLSDVHVGSSEDLDAGNNGRAKKAFQFLSDPTLRSEVVVVNGDLTGNGSWREFDVFRRLRNEFLTPPLIATMGNHDENQWDYFEQATGSLANDVKVVNGYYFIMVSPGAGSLDGNTMRATQAATGSYDYIAGWLAQQIATAEAADVSGKKPIFVFIHHPMTGTHYLSDEQGATGLYDVLEGHGNVVAFSGHTHGVNNHPLDIWQDGGFTTVNTAATCAGELSNRLGAASGNVPFGISEASQGLYVTADANGGVSVKTRDFRSDRWLYDWRFNVTEPLPYTTAGRRAAAAAPTFETSADIRVTGVSMTTVAFEFDRASVADTGVDDFDYYYRYVIVNKESGETEREYTDWSGWFLADSPGVIAQEVRGLTDDTAYELRIYAVDAYGLESAGYLHKAFSTTAVDNTYHAPIDYRLSFDGTLANAGSAPNAVRMFGLPEKPENYIPTATYGQGRHGQAIHLQPNNFVDLDGGAARIDYDQSFSTAFWINVEYARVDGDPVLVSNKNEDTSAHKGWLIGKENENQWISLLFSPTSGEPGKIRLTELTPSEWIVDGKSFATDTWIHIAATFDYENNKIIAYVNGEKVGEADADLAGGIGGITGEGKNKSTFLGSSPWNYTEEHGGYNGSGSTNDVMHNGVLEPRNTISFWADDFVLSSCVYTQEEIVALMGDIGSAPDHFTVTFDTDGGEPQPVDQEVYAGRTVFLPAEPSKSGDVFRGWYNGETAYDFGAAVAGPLGLTAKWESGAGGDQAPVYSGGDGSSSGGRTSNTPAAGAATPTAVSAPADAQPDPGAPFTDVKTGDWFRSDVDYVWAKNLMDGTGETLFSPQRDLTRSMIVTILYRHAGSPASDGAQPFSDVAAGQYYAGAVRWAAANGVVSGVGGDTFAPEAPITRQDLAVLLHRYAGFAGIQLSATRDYPGFQDDADISGYAKEAVAALFKAAIVEGKPGDVFDPRGATTRAEAAALLHRFLEAAERG
jgi:uncharacterized repeat protein (TIGR02543 family)